MPEPTENQPRSPWAVTLAGPTAIGKTKAGIALAKALNGEVISADSRQFFRKMDIGTAKAPLEERDGIEHHMIDIADLTDRVSAGEFAERAVEIARNIVAKGKIPIVVGGSGLYMSALTEGLASLPYDERLRKELNTLHEKQGLPGLLDRLRELDPRAESEIDAQNPMRVMRAMELVSLTSLPLAEVRKLPRAENEFRWIKLGLHTDRKVLYDRINARVDEMIREGLEGEVRSLLAHRDAPPMQTMGYREWFAYFDGEQDFKETVRLIKRNTRRFAKRQITWFGRDEEIAWFTPDDLDGMIAHVKSHLEED